MMSVHIISGFGGKIWLGHVTCKQEVAADPTFGIRDTDLPIQSLYTIHGPTMKIKGSLLMSVPIISGFGRKIWLGHVTCK